MDFASFSLYCIVFASTLVKFSFACGDSLDHSSDVVSVLNVTVKSVGTNDVGNEKLAYILVNNKNYAPQTKGYNVAVFDLLSGRFLTSSAFDCTAKQDECDRMGEFLRGLPQDVVVLMAIQLSAVDNTTLPPSEMNDVGAKNAGSVQAHNSHAVIGYKGKKKVSWTEETYKGSGSGPTEISSSIPINCAYVSQDSTTCNPFNVASQKYGGSCLNQSSNSGNSNGCENVLDGNTTVGWESASNEAVNSFIQIGFHTTFVVDKLRIMQKTSSGQQIQEMLLEFSDCSMETITLAGNTSNFEGFTFLARRTSWVKFTVKKVLGSSGGVGIQEIELNNDLCKQKTICDLTQLTGGGQSNRYRLHRTQFPLMIDAKDDVSVLLTSDSREQSSGYSILIGSNGKVVLKRQSNQSKTLTEFNTTGSLLKENEMRLFWIDATKDRLIFGSGEKVYLFWREAQPVKVKYAFFSATSSSAKFQICARVDHCYKDASHYWPLDKSTIYQKDINGDGSLIGKIRGPWSLQVGPSNQSFTPLALSLTGSNWVDFSFKKSGKESCVHSPSQCPNGISVSFKASISGDGTGYILSSGGKSSSGFAIYYVDSVMHFSLRDGQKNWKVQISFEKNNWQTFAMSWSQQNGLTAIVYNDSASVLHDPIGKIVTVTPLPNHLALLTIGRTGDKGDAYAKAVIRDVAVWEEEITEKKMSNLHVCNDPASCATGWLYFDGSCYKVMSKSLTFHSARNSCLSQGADLVKISSEEENTFVKNETGSQAWIRIEQTDNAFYWKDGSGVSFKEWKNGSSGSCVVMEVQGTWRKSNCSAPGKYICEQVVRHHLGCYEDNAVSPNFIFNPGGYKPNRMTPGLCMHSCGASDFTYAALKNGNLCLCANSTSKITEHSPDMCLSSCFGAGNLKCGGETYISVYKTVQARPLRLTLTLDLPITTLTGFNLTMTPKLPEDQIVDHYVINVGDGTEYYTKDSVATLALIESGNYTIRGKAIAKHSDTGHLTVVESSTTVSATSNVSGVNFFCPSVGSVNMTFSCSLKFNQGANVETTIQFEDGVDRNTVVPDAEILTLGILESDSESQVTADGLYLLAGMDVTNKGEVVGLEMDVKQGGFLDLKIYRPTCNDQKQLYCQAKRVCVTRTANKTSCPVGKTDTCHGENVFSFKQRQCATESCSENNTLNGANVNFDYEHVSSYMVYLTSGHKLFLIESTNQRLQVEEGDVIGVRFPSTGPAAALKTSSKSFSFLYNISEINATTTLRSNRLPSTEDSPTELHYAPSIAILYSAVSETKFEHQFLMAGHEAVSFSVGNSRGTESFTREVILQEAITDFQLKLPDAFPYGETVNVTAEIVYGTNVTYVWEFGDGENATTSSPWVTHVYRNKTGTVTLNVMAINKVSLMSIWCTAVIQERIAGMEFRETALLPIENGTTANIGWLLRNGSHVDFNITITSTGDNRATNLSNPKVPGAIFFAIYKTNLTIPGLYLVSITATNKVNSLKISGNLSVQRSVYGVQMTHPGFLRTNQTFNFTILPHQGEEWARYTLLAMDGTTINTSDKVIPHVYRKAGRYKVSLIASNDISSVVVRCAELIVQDVIKGLEFRSFRREVGVMEEARVHWKLNQGSEISILVDYGDGESKLFEKNITVGDIFVAISLHNYSAPGEYLVNITVTNHVDSRWINTTIYVETPVKHLTFAVERGSLQIFEGGRCRGIRDLYIAVNDSVTVTADISNGTNVNVVFDFGEGKPKSKHHPREFPTNGTTENHAYSTEGAYNITVTLYNRNQKNGTDRCEVIVQYPIDAVLLTSNSPQPSDPGEVALSFHFPGYNASGPFNVTYDFGDNETGSFFLRDKKETNHSYPKQGVYTATVKVCNEISCGNAYVEIIIQDKIHGLQIFSHLTNFIDECPGDNFRPTKGVFPKEYDVFFNSSITNGTNVTYSWNFSRDNDVCKGMNCIRKFSSTGNHTICLTAKNNVSSKTVNETIIVHESIRGVKLRNDGPAEMNTPINFSLSMDQVGNDSCFTIDLKDETHLLSYRSGKGRKKCDGGKTFEGSKNFSHTYKEAKPYLVSFKGDNSVSCVKIESEETKAAIVKGECIFPIITAPGIGKRKEKSTKFKKSEKIEIKTVNTLKCYNYSTRYYWNMSRLDDSVSPTPNLFGSIRLDRPNLLIPPRTLDYSLYELQFSINMLAEPGVYTMEKFYINITKTDLVAFIDGGTKRTVGNEDALTLDAGKSYDPDTEAEKKLNVERCNCTFAWFCKKEFEDENYTLPVNLTDLPPIPTPPVQNITANDSIGPQLGGCYGYGPGQLSFMKVQDVLNTTKMTPNTTYRIRFIIAKDTRVSYRDQTIEVTPGSPPTLAIECEQCEKKINPSSKLTLQGKGTSKGGQRVFYRWEVENITDLEKSASTPSTSRSLVIKPNTFEGGKDYEITLYGKIQGGEEGLSTLKITVNEPPKKGSCKPSPSNGDPLDPIFTLKCEGFTDEDEPLIYEFLYSTSPDGENKSLGSGLEKFRESVAFPSGLQDHEFNLTLYAKVTDNLGAATEVEFTENVKVEKKEISVGDLQKKATERLESIMGGGNVRETASYVLSVAEVLNDQSPSTAEDDVSKEDKKKSEELREKLAIAVVDLAKVSEETSLSDVTQFASTLTAVTNKPEQNTEKIVDKVSNLYDDASKAILKQATDNEGASSEEIQGASKAVFGGAVNLIKSADVKQKKPEESSGENKNNTQMKKVLGTLDTLSQALTASKVPGEEATTIDTPSLSMGVSKEDIETLGKKPVTIGNSQGAEVKLPENSAAFGNGTLDQVAMLSEINFYPGGQASKQINNSKLVSFTFYTSVNKSREEFSVKLLEPGKEISVMVPRKQPEVERHPTHDKLHTSKFKLHKFVILDNSSAVTIETKPELPVEVEMYVKVGGEPNPSQGEFDFNVTLSAGRTNSLNSTIPSSSYEYLLSNDVLNWTAAGNYSVMVRYKLPENRSFTEDQLGDGIGYNFSVYTSSCLYHDPKTNIWRTDGVKVGPKSNVTHTECLTNHLTTFGSNFFVAPNTIDFKNLSPDQLLESPHALVAVCVILGFYLLCLIPARKADKNDALKTGVTPLPDNDSRDTYCYEVQVHTGFVRGAGSSAEVSIVVTGALGDSEPRVMKDPKRKTFKTGAVDAFLLTVPQSLGNLKQIRVWHNNGGTYPSWNLLRIMIQDIQTDQRWWFVCDDWLAVEEGDGKIEKTLFPASKKELTKFNVLFTSEVRKNLTDGHIWFSVVARPPRSNFTRVQRLTCCLSILLCTMVSNAMFYKIGQYETPKNAINIMGFSFSIRSVSIGIISSVVVFPINLIIVTLFRKAKPKENRYSVKTEGEEIDDIDIEMGGERKKTAQKKGLPHWFVYVAYGIAFLAVVTSGSFVVMYGMQFGSDKSAAWLSSMTISFLQDILLNQPIKVFALATLFALLIKDPKKAEGDSYAEVNALATDEEWLHKNTEDLDDETQKALKTLIIDKPPDEAKLEIARQLRMKEKQMKSIIQEIAWYMIFLLVLLTISYGNRDLKTSQVTRYMQNIFEKATYSGNLTFNKVHEINHYWKWLNETFIPSLNPEFFYNNSTQYEEGYLADTPNAWLLGVARLRQLRIKKDTCKYKRAFHHVISECNDFYSMELEDQGSYLPGWKVKPLIPPLNSSSPTPSASSTPSQEPQVPGPWAYQSGTELKTYPYWGYKATYSAGGYVQMLPKDINETLTITGNLSLSKWLDRYTRAIFSEFAIYNANTNLFCVVTLLFEQLPTGSLTPYPSILTLRLFRYVGGEMYFVLTCEIVYLLFSTFFVVKEIKMFVKKGRKHLKNPWSILEILVTLLSLSAVGLYFARLKFTEDAIRDMNTDRTAFVSFHYTAFLDEWLKCIMGLIVFFSFLKLFRLLRFNRRMSLLQQVLKRSFIELLSFMFMFALAFLAFALLACLVFGQAMEGFGTFLRSCASLMDTILGKFTLKEMFSANRVIGPIFFYTYTVTMVFVLINMFLSIINDAFAEVRSDVEKQSNEYEIVDFMVHRLKENIGKSIGHAIHPVYKEPKSELELNFDRIADDADNAMHFMRNITFEDMRKTRWFQSENCTEKKKNLMRLLMEVDWDYYEEELCDSIPVFEKFLNQHSEDELESVLQYYQQKRMVEDMVFDQVNGSGDDDDSSDESNSDSDDSNDDSDGINSDDEKLSDDEKGSEEDVDDETNPLAKEIDVRVGSSVSHRGSVMVNLGTEMEPSRIQSPSFLITDTEPTAKENLTRNTPSADGRSSFSDSQAEATENELIQILHDVQRNVESRCATDAEIESIFGDSLSIDGDQPLKFDSEPENTGSKKKNDKKRKKKKENNEKMIREKNTKDAWVVATDEKADNTSTGEPQEQKVKRRKEKKGKRKENTEELERPLTDPCTRDEVDEELLKPKKKGNKQGAGANEGEEETAEPKIKKKKAKESAVEDSTGGDIEEETNVETGKKDKKKKKKKRQEHTDEAAQMDPEMDEKPQNETKKKKKQKLNQSTVDDDDGRSSVRSNDTEKTLLEVRPPKKKKQKKTKPTGKEIGPRDESEC